MKKILTIILGLVIFAEIADAQIGIRKSEVGRPKQVSVLSMSWSWIYQEDDSYFLVMKSDNPYDDSYWLKIGKTIDECLESLNSLREMMDNMGETERYEIDNGLGETFSVTQTKELGIKKLLFHGEYYAGTGHLIQSNINKAIKWIEKNVK